MGDGAGRARVIALQVLPVALSLLLLAAHFLRSGQTALVAVCLAGIALVAVPRRWAAHALRAVLVLGALEWVRTLVVFAGERAATGRPWLRLVLILGAVAALTAASALVFRVARVRRRFRLAEGTPAAPASPGDRG